MKTLNLFGLMLLLNISFAFAQESIRIEVSNIKNTKGNVLVGLFDKDERFLKETFKDQTVKINGEKVEIIFSNVPPGEYAISVIHDENENGELDSNSIGIPKEGFGFGNDAMGMFGPPSFDKAKVKVDGENQKFLIKMKYL